MSLTSTPAPIAPLPIPLNPQIINPPPVPAAPPWYAKWLQRKFLLAVATSAMGVLALYSHALPLSFELITWIIAPILVWIVGEAHIDAKRIVIPEVPGMADDVARALLKAIGLVQEIPKAPAPDPVQTSAPTAPTDAGFASSRLALLFGLVAAAVLAAIVGFSPVVDAAQPAYPIERTLPYNDTTAGTFGRVVVSSSAGGTTVLAGNTSRRAFCVQNTGAVVLYCARGTTVSATNYAIILEPNAALANDRGGSAWCVDGWGGSVQCQAASGSGLVGSDSF